MSLKKFSKNPCCPSCGVGKLVAKMYHEVEQLYRHIGDEEGKIEEFINSRLDRIQCLHCHKEWKSHTDLCADVEANKDI